MYSHVLATLSLSQDAGVCTATLGDITSRSLLLVDNCTTDANLLVNQLPAVGSAVNDGDMASVRVIDEAGNTAVR
ncbi:MAG: hypothetical protein IPG92_07725, partial [Flavobacteriales bacterium]|nr:hypothetical protein [Flavobacteriales bacterium]